MSNERPRPKLATGPVGSMCGWGFRVPEGYIILGVAAGGVREAAGYKCK